ncbi:MAG: hypothetical protein AAFN10_14890 [Bacteroidota bacterium]
MNELEAKGQKWFLLVIALGVGPSIWRLVKYVFRIIQISPSDMLLGYQMNLVERMIILFLVGGIFFLMYR